RPGGACRDADASSARRCAARAPRSRRAGPELRTPCRLLVGDVQGPHRNISTRRFVQAAVMAPRSALLAMCLLLAVPAAARPATADLSVGMDGPEFAVVDAEAAYTVTVANAGPSAATGVTVTDPIPAGARYVRTSGDGTCTPGATLRCTLPSLAAGRTATMT